MQLKVAFLTSGLLVATPALAIEVKAWAGAECTGDVFADEGNGVTGTCYTLCSNSAKSFSYSGVPSQAQFFESGGAHDSCTNGATLVTGGGSGCATAPDGQVLWSCD